ncbi:MAG: hypothetical protein HQL58_01945 [Magnetococcales bacterium]|nr:hypothetical protein [Magnetococcales bacterium]
MVIVILGVLAALATPKFVSLIGEADQSAIKAVAGALSSASSINYSACVAANSSCQAVRNCGDGFDRLVDTLETAYLKSKYRIQSSSSIAKGSSTSCVLELIADSTITAPFTLIGTEAP